MINDYTAYIAPANFNALLLSLSELFLAFNNSFNKNCSDFITSAIEANNVSSLQSATAE